MSTENTRKDLAHRVEVLRARLADEGFLNNRGLGNEVGIYTFCYDPSLELEVRELVRTIENDAEDGVLPCRIVERNLYDILLDYCDSEDIYEDALEMEREEGQKALFEELSGFSPRDYARAVMNGMEDADVLFITGVGEAYPFVRAHSVMDNIQPLIGSLPVVVFYPGRFTGQTLSLFGRLEDGNYYRAFDLI